MVDALSAARALQERAGLTPAEGIDPPSGTTEIPRSWPEPIAEEAYHGITGEIVRAIEPDTEADPRNYIGLLRQCYWQRTARYRGGR